MWMEHIAVRIEDERKEKKHRKKDRHHDVEDFFPRKAVGQVRKEEGEKDGARKHRPHFDEWDCFGARMFRGDYNRVFVRS